LSVLSLELLLVSLLKIRVLIAIVSTLLISKSAIASSLSTKANPNLVNGCLQIGNRSLVSINDSPAQSKIKKQSNNIARRYTSSNFPQRSIWWAAEQFDPFEGKLIQDWLTHPQKQQINLTVDLQLWSLLDYFGRYRFVNQFGAVARKYGYSLNIMNEKLHCLATYKYNSISQPPRWELKLQQLGEDSLQLDKPEKQKSQIVND